MSRWTIVVLLSLALPALADRPRRGPPAGARGGDSESGLAPQDEKAVHDYKLSKDKLAKLADAGRRMKELEKKDPAIRKAEKEAHDRNFDETAKFWEGYPKAVAAVKAAGLSPREYMVGITALVTASMFAGMKQSYPDMKAPAYVNPDNVKFILDHPETTQQFKGLFDADRGHDEKGGQDEADDKAGQDDDDRDEEKPAKKQ